MSVDPPRNPFATGNIRPGAIPFFFPPGKSVATVIEQLAQQNWQGEILGPHGSGKSTLLAAMMEPLGVRGRNLVSFTLRSGERRLPLHTVTWTADTLVIVDGAEQLSWLSRWRLRRQCRISRAGLLWTTHRPLGLPLLWQTQPDLALMQQVVGHLLAENRVQLSPQQISAAFGDVRETLFRLYDLFQQRSRQESS
jgi:predicted ATPase